MFWTHGSSIVQEDRFEPQAALRTLQDEACTTAYLIPVMLEKILAQPNFKSFDLTRLRTGTVVTNDPDVMARAVNELGMSGLYSTYGMSELSSVVLRSFSHDPLEVTLQSHGSPMPDIEVRVADPDSNERLPPGREGEIQIRGYNVMPGYYKKPVETAAAFTPDGWFKTGDAGVEREDGNFRFISRLKDGYKYNGLNVSTVEVEATLGVPFVRRGRGAEIYTTERDSGTGAAKPRPRASARGAGVGPRRLRRRGGAARPVAI